MTYLISDNHELLEASEAPAREVGGPGLSVMDQVSGQCPLEPQTLLQ